MPIVQRQSRTRTRGQFGTAAWTYTTYYGNGGVQSVSSGVYGQASGTVESMNDVVVKPFVPGVTIINSAMNRRSETRSCPPWAYEAWHSNPNPGSVGRVVGSIEQSREDVRFDQKLALLPTREDPLLRLAATRALAQVRKPEVSGLVTIAEMRSTVQSLLNPIGGALKFLARNAPSRRKVKRMTKKNAVQSAKAVADQHLTVVFGLLPFISDIQGILRALAAIEPWPVRMTARGEAEAFDELSPIDVSVTYPDSNSKATRTDSFTVSRNIKVRAYQLYEASVSLDTALGLSLSDVSKAVWQTTSLSFVVDWFANVGDFISALTPQPGIKYLASGYTIETTEACFLDSKIIQGAKPGATTNFWNAKHSAAQSRVVVAKRREPAYLLDHVGLASRHESNKRDLLDAFKVTAGISLIIQRLKG